MYIKEKVKDLKERIAAFDELKNAGYQGYYWDQKSADIKTRALKSQLNAICYKERRRIKRRKEQMYLVHFYLAAQKKLEFLSSRCAAVEKKQQVLEAYHESRYGRLKSSYEDLEARNSDLHFECRDLQTDLDELRAEMEVKENELCQEEKLFQPYQSCSSRASSEMEEDDQPLNDGSWSFENSQSYSLDDEDSEDDYQLGLNPGSDSRGESTLGTHSDLKLGDSDFCLEPPRFQEASEEEVDAALEETRTALSGWSFTSIFNTLTGRSRKPP